jgi:hypothetical protein
MLNWRFFYWMVAGALIGFGAIGILSIGLPFLFIGLGMVTYGIIHFRARGFWAALIGFGTLPALILIVDILTAPPPCTGQPLTLPPNTSMSCSYIPDSYYIMAVIFGAIALVGMAWPLLRRLRIHS